MRSQEPGRLDAIIIVRYQRKARQIRICEELLIKVGSYQGKKSPDSVYFCDSGQKHKSLSRVLSKVVTGSSQFGQIESGL